MRGGVVAPVLAVLLLGGCALGTRPAPKPLLAYEERMELGRIYEVRGDGELAMKEFARAAALANGEDGEARAFFAVGNIRLARREHDLAEENFKRAIELDPTVGVYYNNIAWVYLEMDLYSLAEHNARMGLSLDIEKSFIYLDTIGVIATNTQRYDEAERLFKEALVFISVIDVVGLYHIYVHMHDLFEATGDSKKAGEVRDRIRELKVRWPGPGVYPGPYPGPFPGDLR